MKIQKRTVAEVESVLSYLLGVCSSVEQGDRVQLERGAFAYAREIVMGAEGPLKKLGLYEAAEHAVNEGERLILAGEVAAADELILKTAREMMEKSGTNDRLRKLYAPPVSKRKH